MTLSDLTRTHTGRAGLCEIDRDKWGRLSNRFWLGAIICNLIRDGYEILQLMQKKVICMLNCFCKCMVILL